jgi:hypothetical protein
VIPFSLVAIGGLGLIAAAAIGYATLENSWRQTAELQVSIEQEANKQNQRTIRLLGESNRIYEEIAADLRKEVEAISAKQEEDDAAITKIETADEIVRKFLDTPIPPNLRCVLNNEKCENGNKNPNAE